MLRCRTERLSTPSGSIEFGVDKRRIAEYWRRWLGAGISVGILSALVLTPVPVASQQSVIQHPAGSRPTYTDRKLTIVPNGAAVSRSMWVPGLDDGFVPQGLTLHDDALFVAGYISTDPEKGRGPCRLYRIDPARLTVTGRLDLPPVCGHAGGLARGPAGTLYVADTRAVIEVRLAAPGSAEIGAVVQTIKLAGNLLGSFAAGSSDALWLGGYRREGQSETRLYRIPHASLAGGEISDVTATMSLPLPDRAQGATFASDGQLWITRSGSKFGELVRLDPRTGAIQASYAMPAGLEDISFDRAGRLWAVGEAGSQRWNGWATFFPLVFQLDTGRLQ